MNFDSDSDNDRLLLKAVCQWVATACGYLAEAQRDAAKLKSVKWESVPHCLEKSAIQLGAVHEYVNTCIADIDASYPRIPASWEKLREAAKTDPLVKIELNRVLRHLGMEEV